MLRASDPSGSTWPPVEPVEMVVLSDNKIVLTVPHPTRGELGQAELATLTINEKKPVLEVGSIGLRGHSIPHSLTVSGNLVYFVCDDGVHGEELWVTDGTRDGTRLVKDILFPSTPSAIKP